MFGFLKRKKKQSYDERPVGCDAHSPPPPTATEIPVESEDDGYFLNERDIKVIVSACVFFAKSGKDGEIIAQIPETGGKLRDKTKLSPDDVTVISICLQAYNAEMSKLMIENPESPAVFKLRDEKVYFLTIIEKLTKYLTA